MYPGLAFPLHRLPATPTPAAEIFLTHLPVEFSESFLNSFLLSTQLWTKLWHQKPCTEVLSPEWWYLQMGFGEAIIFEGWNPQGAISSLRKWVISAHWRNLGKAPRCELGVSLLKTTVLVLWLETSASKLYKKEMNVCCLRLTVYNTLLGSSD